MKISHHSIWIIVLLATVVNSPVCSFMRESHGITVIVSDYGIRGQRYVLPEAGVNAQDLVNKGIYPIKISITNKSNEVVTVSTDSIGLVQYDYDSIANKLGNLAVRHVLSILGGSVFAGLGIASLRSALVENYWNANYKFNGVLSAVIYGSISAACFGYAWYDSKKLNDKLTKSLSELGFKGSFVINPGLSLEKFIFIDQETYNKINTCNIILKKGGDPIAFQMPLD